MLLRPNTRIDEVIVQLLGQRAGANAKELHQSINQKFKTCSIQGVYHELRKLQEQGVVLKIKDSYHLSISWASELVHFADCVYDNYVSSASAAAILPVRGERKLWHFSNLLRMDDLWIQTMQAMYAETGAKQLFAFNAYPWFYFAQPRKVEQYYDFVRREKRQFFYVLGEETYLSRKYVDGIGADIFSYSFAQAPFETRETRYFTCVPPYLVYVDIDAACAARIRSLFQSVRSDADVEFTRIDRALNQPAKLRIQIVHQERKASRIQKQFKDFFGV